jgi:hypothetical protein
MQSQIQKIKRVAVVGEAEFNYLGMTEEIMQGWDGKRTVYLFKTPAGRWAYSPPSGGVQAILDWRNEDEAMMNGKYIKMAPYKRIHLKFIEPFTYKVWNGKEEEDKTISEGIIVVTESCHQIMEDATKGRSKDAVYKLKFGILPNKNKYADGLIFVK